MYNDFVVVGPPNDPANLRQAVSVADAFFRIASANAKFVSRGDESGTHKREIILWALSEQDITRLYRESWYLESATGMGTTLNIAINKEAYTLSDRGTWIKFANKSDFEILFEGGEELFNPYGVIRVNPNLHPHVQTVKAQALIDWLAGEEAQQLINSYRVKGEQLFFVKAK